MEEAPPPPRSVSELIEVWQDWTYQRVEKKRPRRWSSADSIASESTNYDGRKKSRHGNGGLSLRSVSFDHAETNNDNFIKRSKRKQWRSRRSKERHSYDGAVVDGTFHWKDDDAFDDTVDNRIITPSKGSDVITTPMVDHDGIQSPNHGGEDSGDAHVPSSSDCRNHPDTIHDTHVNTTQSNESGEASPNKEMELYSSMDRSNSVPPSPNDDGVFLFGLAERLETAVENTKSLLDETTFDGIVADAVMADVSDEKEGPRAETERSSDSQNTAEAAVLESRCFTTHPAGTVHGEMGAAADEASLNLSEIVSDDDSSSSLPAIDQAANDREEYVSSFEERLPPLAVVVDGISLEPLETVRDKSSQPLPVASEREAAAQQCDDYIGRDGTAAVILEKIINDESVDFNGSSSDTNIERTTGSPVEVCSTAANLEGIATSSEIHQSGEQTLESNLLQTLRDESEHLPITSEEEVAKPQCDDYTVRDGTIASSEQILSRESVDLIEHSTSSQLEVSPDDNQEEPVARSEGRHQIFDETQEPNSLKTSQDELQHLSVTPIDEVAEQQPVDVYTERDETRTDGNLHIGEDPNISVDTDLASLFSGLELTSNNSNNHGIAKSKSNIPSVTFEDEDENSENQAAINTNQNQTAPEIMPMDKETSSQSTAMKSTVNERLKDPPVDDNCTEISKTNADAEEISDKTARSVTFEDVKDVKSSIHNTPIIEHPPQPEHEQLQQTVRDSIENDSPNTNGHQENKEQLKVAPLNDNGVALSKTGAQAKEMVDNTVHSVTLEDAKEVLTNSQPEQNQLQQTMQDSRENNSPNTNGHQDKKLGHRSKRRTNLKRRSHIAIVERDASFAFSPYRLAPSKPIDALCTQKNSVEREEDNQTTSNKHAHECVSNDAIQYLISQSNDSVLEQYLEKMDSVKNFYDKTQPFRIGRRNLPQNQVEVVLRRRAVKKREAAVIGSSANTDASTQSIVRGSSKTPLMHSRNNIPRPSSSVSSSPRRTIFSTVKGHSRNHSLGLDTSFEDDSTISSTATWATGNASTAISMNNVSTVDSGGIIGKEAPLHQLPEEEIVGDTSLGLKLTILHGKVIVQSISSLEDTRASPAQLCGLFCPGDVLISINDVFLVNGSIHVPVPMDKMVEALKPLSEPIEGNGRYSREVRLRFVVGMGKKLLREQKERGERKQRIEDERKRMGLDGKAGAKSVDHAADIFGLSALMGVDQHTGMPMFQDHHLETHHEEDQTTNEANGSANDEQIVAVTLNRETPQPRPSFFTKSPPLLQLQISNQVASERQWMLDHNTSEYFILDSKASLLLRPPTPIIVEESADAQSSTLDPVEVRQNRLNLGRTNISHATELVSNVEKQERGVDTHDDLDPMEVASRICGTASVRTGASRRRWHRGDNVSVILEEQSYAVSASSMDNQADANTLISEESGEMCDHRMLVDLAANHQSWRRNVIIRLEEYATSTEKASNDGNESNSMLAENRASTGLDSLLFGSNVAKLFEKKKCSLALPPGEMTQMLFDLKEHLDGGLPMHIFTNDDQGADSVHVTFVKPPTESDIDVSRATDFLVNEALGVWLKSFRPLPWKQRRALWPLNLSANHESASMVSSHFDDGMSLSLASVTTHSTAKYEKRQLREIIEELELDLETRRETCNLVTFYFTRKYLSPRRQIELSDDEEKTALQIIDEYGSYLDLNKTLVLAGKLQSQSIVKKIVDLAKFDPQHREAMKRLESAKMLLFYEPTMLSALHDLLQTGAYNSLSANFDIIRLLVSAYPDLSPVSVKAASCDRPDDFYFKYLSLLMHPEEGSDTAKHDGRFVKEWCSMLCSSVESHDEHSDASSANFYHIACASDEHSPLYHRDLPFLLDISIKMAEYNLALDIATEILSVPDMKQNQLATSSIAQHLRHISETAIAGDFDSLLLGQIITFYTNVFKITAENLDTFDIITELTRILQLCMSQDDNNPSREDLNKMNSCLNVISENAAPSDGIKVLSELDMPGIELSFKISAIHTMLTRGARENVENEISGSLLRIQRVREDQQRLDFDEGVSVYNNLDEGDGEEEAGGFIWPSILDGRMVISK